MWNGHPARSFKEGGAIPADGWIKTSKCDKAGVPYYAPESKKAPRLSGREEFIYSSVLYSQI
ncbi:hypothetical protein [Dulcicalothrix desertica]|uniref:hypothetical protein n=1 Tax=Dulcicalothrix desertica TaxID=32056 RepID=UPI000F8EDEE5|nr:hypothetical protein [Dulcicalothrix desertica]